MKLNSLLRSTTCAATLLLATLSPSTHSAPVLVGSATLNAAGDLTVIQDGPQTFEFLDVSTTAGMSVATAVATYGATGFHWATGAEVAELYAAFGIAYQSIPTTYVILAASLADTANLVSYIGATLGDAALGWIDDNTASFYHTYSCIGATTCMPNAFVENTSSFWPGRSEFGVYLVRQQARQAPEPGSLCLVSLAFIYLLKRRVVPTTRSS